MRFAIIYHNRLRKKEPGPKRPDPFAESYLHSGSLSLKKVVYRAVIVRSDYANSEKYLIVRTIWDV